MLRASYDSSKHPHCADRGTAATATAPTQREQQLEATVKACKRKLVNATSTNELLQAQVDSAAAAKKACTDASRQESNAEVRRVDIDPANKDKLNKANKYHSREPRVQLLIYWIAQTVGTGNGSCVAKQCKNRETVNDICFSPGDYVLAIRW